MKRTLVSGALRACAVVVVVVVAVSPARAAPALPAEIPCTLKKAVKVSEGGAWRVIAQGSDLTITFRTPTWTSVVVDGKPGRAATTFIDQACDLPPAPPEAEAPVVVKKPPKAAPVKPVAKPEKNPRTKIVAKPTTTTPTTAPSSADPRLLHAENQMGAVPEPPSLTVVPLEPLAADPMVPTLIETGPATTTTTPPAPVFAPPPPPPSTSRPLRIAVQRIEGAPEDERLIRVATDAIVVELRKLQKVSVIGFDEVQALLDLEAQKQLAGCEAGSCISEIADALGADALITGAIARVDDAVVIGFKRLDPHQGRAVAVFTRRLDDQRGEECLAAIGPAVEELFAEVPVRPGFTRGVDPQVGLRLNPPPAPLWVFATAATTTGVAAATTGVALAVYVGASGSAEGLIARSSQETVAAKDLTSQIDLAQSSFTVAVVAGVVATTLAASTVVIALFTDWQGHQDE